MNTTNKKVSSSQRLSPETQYHEVYENLRYHHRQIWQTLSITAVIDGALIVSTFATINVWWVREIILGFSLVLTIILTYSLIKHRYFSYIEQGTLSAIENKYAEFCVQRKTSATKGVKYWDSKNPSKLQKLSAQVLYNVCMAIIISLIIVLLILNPILLKCS